MTSERYHKAAKDGLLDVLKEATRREVNSKDTDGMTPVLWAAFEGKLDALRLLVGRGGEPDKSDQFGNTALHLAAAKGHMQCVDFLVKFGANIYSLDIDNHSAKDLAAINNRDDILRYLDGAAANLEVSDRKRAKSLKEQAQKAKEKRSKQYAKNQLKMEQEYDNDVTPMPHRPSTVLAKLTQKLWASQGNLKDPATNNQPIHKDVISANHQTKFSSFVGGTISNGTKSVVARKLQLAQKKIKPIAPLAENGGEFKVGEIEASGKRSVRSLQGVRRDSEILYVGTYNSISANAGKRGKITDVFEVNSMNSANSDEEDVNEDETIKTRKHTLMRASSQPDFLNSMDEDEYDNDDQDDVDHQLKDEVMLQRPSGLFERPMLGSLAFTRSVNAALEQVGPANVEAEVNTNSQKKTSQTKKNNGRRRSQLVIQSDSDSDGDSTDSDDSENTTPIERFLAAWGLEEYYPIFQKQDIDLDTLLLLTETDLKTLNLPLGPFRKLVIAITERKNALTSTDGVVDVQL